LKKEN